MEEWMLQERKKQKNKPSVVVHWLWFMELLCIHVNKAGSLSPVRNPHQDDAGLPQHGAVRRTDPAAGDDGQEHRTRDRPPERPHLSACALQKERDHDRSRWERQRFHRECLRRRPASCLKLPRLNLKLYLSLCPRFLMLCCDRTVLTVLSPQTQLEMFQGLVRKTSGVTLKNVETQSQTAVTGLLAFLPQNFSTITSTSWY